MEIFGPGWTQYAYPLVGALVAGGLIGFEREYRGRPAGLRTHMLMCLSSALLMLAAVHQVRWLTDTPHDVIRIDPVRMAHGVLTGIGFLCGGVIFRQGLSVHGLTTAASLWTTSAIGILYGVGFYGLAVSGTIVTLVVLALLRSADTLLPKLELIDVSVRYRRAEAPTPAEFRSLISELGFKSSPGHHRLRDGGDLMEIAAHLKARKRQASDAIIAKLSADPRVVEFEVTPRSE
jgi:putative Mg2+ transporter-C (MgtC) family protein